MVNVNNQKALSYSERAFAGKKGSEVLGLGV